MSTSGWIWSTEHNDHWTITYDDNNQPTYYWASQYRAQQNQAQQVQAQQNQAQLGERDATAPASATKVPSDLITNDAETSGTGWYHILDPSYQLRSDADAHQYFSVGRVFALLFTESAASTNSLAADDCREVVRFGEGIYSTIRRFVVVRVHHSQHFVYALAISTYRNMGTLRSGCEPWKHTIVHNQGTTPTYFQGEYEHGMRKEPIEVIPTDSSTYLSSAARLNFGKMYSIDWKVKTKDLGMVRDEHKWRLIQYWKEEDQHGHDEHEE